MLHTLWHEGWLTSNLGHISRLGGARALKLDTSLLLDEGNEALLVATHQGHTHSCLTSTPSSACANHAIG